MKQVLAKYFWGFNAKALKETEKILKDPQHPRFIERLVTILSRCDKPKELFSFISKDEFVEVWPKTKNYWRKIALESDFRDWWQTIYERLMQKYKPLKKPKGKPPASFLKIGRMIKQERIKKGLTQSGLALRVGMRQPDISKIEEGKKNITLQTLDSLCKILEIKNIEL
ncbi:MAG: hypothetical protein A2984_01045 [Omnitrophica WOR_2 bacterium RIFCSPLOWO2_01_FULL_41_12]|nr:MAG: hypothetical protein A2984_01045 [Omnitrophica WOR_2 bacterium RIFCSPLOWO2_01_FULL_41_12]